MPLPKDHYIEKFSADLAEMNSLEASLRVLERIEGNMKELMNVSDQVKLRETRMMESLGVFAAIVTFIATSVSSIRFIENGKQALAFMLALASSLGIFVMLILMISRNFRIIKKNQIVIGAMTVTCAAFWGILLLIYPKIEPKEDCCDLKKQMKLPLNKAIVTPAMLDSLDKYELFFEKNDTLNAPNGKSWFKYLSGNSPLLIVAPHATSHMREGKRIKIDGGTGSLAVFLNKNYSIPILFTTYKSPSDPNYYDDNAFKDTLGKIVEKYKPKFIIDLHGSVWSRPYDVDFGTLNNKSYFDKADLFKSLIEDFVSNGLVVGSQDYFSAEEHQTDTKFLHNKGFPCVQCEINSNYLMRSLKKDSIVEYINKQKSAQLLQALIQFNEEVNK
ncbi:MAG: hypothetical protein ACLQQ4_05410 [Bacteroidia bacterium]